MKKITLVFIMVAVGVLAFCAGNKEQKPYEISLGGDLNTFAEAGTVNDQALAAGFSSIGLHLQTSQYFTDSNWGFDLHAAFLFPYSMSLSDGKTTITTDTSDFKSIFGSTLVLGFPYYFMKNDTISIGIGPAINYSMFSMTSDYFAGVGYYFGAGLQLNSQIRLADNWFFNAGAFGLYDFYQFSLMKTAYESTSSSGRTTSIQWNPYIGIGYRMYNRKEN